MSQSPEAMDSVQRFYQAFNEQQELALFACGGALPVSGKDIVIRYDQLSTQGDAASVVQQTKLSFPIIDISSIEDLLRACEPATFGMNNKDVLDENYRKAAKMDTSRFATTVDVHELGVIDAVAQILRPNMSGMGIRHIRAELYKLNIYSGPSGKFKAHVDTPRGETQFGSLVVCLPTSHEGGKLVVRQGTKSMEFDWSSANPKDLCWAAFYSNCKHEVEEVTSGHRVTLTYNLYDTHIDDALEKTGAQVPMTLYKPASAPLVQTLKDLFHGPDLLKYNFRTVGIFLTHTYAHNREDSGLSMPATTLKGIDVVLFKALSDLGLNVQLKPILDIESRCCEEEEGCTCCSCTDVVGEKFYNIKYQKHMNEQQGTDNLLKRNYPSRKHADILWFNQPKISEMALASIAYGNEASLEFNYSAAAMLIEIPGSETLDIPKPEALDHEKKDEYSDGED